MSCRPAGVLSIPGVHGGLIDKVPMGMIMNKGLTLRTGQTHVDRWTDDLLGRIEEGQIDPSFVITHKLGLADGPGMYKTFRDKQDGCIKVVLQPWGERRHGDDHGWPAPPRRGRWPRAWAGSASVSVRPNCWPHACRRARWAWKAIPA